MKMIQTFDFIMQVYRNPKLAERLLNNLKNTTENEINIGVHRLTFDKKNQYVKIECNDLDYIFLCKVIPAK